ncbi:RNA polymerase subunit sigma [Mycolicibacterium sp. OfavD-34-C]|uniref:RNA polymerase subunit sigma n=1 Tax=Mycolicibacterium sp. OfavD-34-C TaxID=2917746 RepID=UPI001EF73860|nr:RNA polymerase subunit sigma [Mycolicibacterium sp. OfavD-34-C]MCG7582797.1 RNA polymerase subunit sigma [Mycolicibacterium sp. OfavD-34-C]
MNKHERARFIASLTDDELRRLRGRMEDPDTRDADKRFARNLFTGSNDAGDQDDDKGAGEYTDEQRQWARELFASLDDENDGFAGFKNGRNVSRTTP